MGTGSLLLAFVGIKVALVVLFWVATARGLALGERIEARKRAEREAAQARAAVKPALVEISRPAA